jgi:NAD+ kinase
VTRLGVVGNRRYEGLPDILRGLLRRAPELGMTLVFEPDLWEIARDGERLDDPSRLDALLTLGGDGTMLRGARLLGDTQVPVLGVNLGRLGFLAAVGGDELDQALARFAAGDFRAESRMRLEAHTFSPASGATVPGEGGGWVALNDVVLHKGGFARVVRLRIGVNEEFVGTYAADGVIVATPTGSTAYSLSAMGPVVVPTVESILITAISPHTLAVRPLVVPPDAVVTVQAEDGPDEILVTVDGQVGRMFAPGETLVVRRAPKPVLVVRFRETTFFSRMRRKLGWGGLWERDESDRC